MKNCPGKYLWITDPHFDKCAPWTIISFILYLKRQKFDGIFITGDISSWGLTYWHLKLLAKSNKCPIYISLGNHENYLSSFEQTHKDIRQLCKDHSNLIWMQDVDYIKLNDYTCIIGADGWYSASFHDPKWLRFTLDWLLIKELRELKTMNERFEMFRSLAQKSANLLEDKLSKVFKETDIKNIYVLTHMPPWKEATRDEGTFLEKYYLPYNVNVPMGQIIEKLMEGRNNRHLTVLSGHSHQAVMANIARNIECWVGAANYLEIGELDRQIIMI